jgi:predicted nucleotidyltransferase
MHVDEFLGKIKDWASTQRDVGYILLVGSHARGAARGDSDIDLVIITERPEQYIDDNSFAYLFGPVKSAAKENWGRVISIRVFYEGGPEVEYGITSYIWISRPLDSGTVRVLNGGCKVIYDQKGDFEDIIKSS